MILMLLACQTPAPNAAPPDVPAPTGTAPTDPSVPSPALPAAEDFTATVQGGATMRLSDHAGDVLLIDIAGFT